MLMIAKMLKMVMRIMMVLVREHNRVAAELAQLHPMWDDEKLYFEVIVMIIFIVGPFIYYVIHFGGHSRP